MSDSEFEDSDVSEEFDDTSLIDEDDDGDLEELQFDDYEEPDEIESRNILHKEIIVIDPSKRRTSHHLTEFELSEIIALRAMGISKHNHVLTDVSGLSSPEKMAEKEINDGVCPLVLRRKVGEVVKDGKLIEYFEYWDVNKMSKPILHD